VVTSYRPNSIQWLEFQHIIACLVTGDTTPCHQARHVNTSTATLDRIPQFKTLFLLPRTCRCVGKCQSRCDRDRSWWYTYERLAYAQMPTRDLLQIKLLCYVPARPVNAGNMRDHSHALHCRKTVFPALHVQNNLQTTISTSKRDKKHLPTLLYESTVSAWTYYGHDARMKSLVESSLERALIQDCGDVRFSCVLELTQHPCIPLIKCVQDFSPDAIRYLGRKRWESIGGVCKQRQHC
jgi:hypothetical protein